MTAGIGPRANGFVRKIERAFMSPLAERDGLMGKILVFATLGCGCFGKQPAVSGLSFAGGGAVA